MGSTGKKQKEVIMAYTKEKLVDLGARFSTQRMMEQLPVSIAAARAHEVDLGAKFPPAKVNEIETYYDQIKVLFGDQAEKKFDAATGNVDVNALLKTVKTYFRDIIAVADNTFEEDPEIRDEFHKDGPIGRSVPKAIRSFETIVALASKHSDALSEWGLTDQDILDAKAAMTALVDANTSQETAIKDLPPKTRELYEAKGRAYLLLKRLARTGRRVFANDPATAAKFNLDILRRKGTRRPTAAQSA